MRSPKTRILPCSLRSSSAQHHSAKGSSSSNTDRSLRPRATCRLAPILARPREVTQPALHDLKINFEIDLRVGRNKSPVGLEQGGPCVAQCRQGLSGVREGLRESSSSGGRLEPGKKRFNGRFSANTATRLRGQARRDACLEADARATLCPRDCTENCPSSVTRRDATRGQLASPSGGSTDALSHGLRCQSRRLHRPARDRPIRPPLAGAQKPLG